mgnify:CR=1 FL=1|jgi:hypothetical protein
MSFPKKNTVWVVVHITLITFFVLSICFFTLSYTVIKSFVDTLASDNNLESFTLSVYLPLRLSILGIGLLSFITLLFSSFYPKKRQALLEDATLSVKALPSRLKDDAKLFWGAVKVYFLQKSDLIFLLVLMLIGTFLRISITNRPISHDEGYTFVNFIYPGLKTLTTDYHLPNNHILYSIFAYFSIRFFGNSPWAFRFPALLAGIFLISVSYFAARQYFNRLAGLLLAGIVATFPVFLLYSSSARGYAQFALLSTLLWFFASILLEKKNLFLWLLFIFSAAAGFYTIPIMLYPYTAIMVWLFFSWFFDEHSNEYTKGKFLKYLFFSGLFVVMLVIMLYLPVFIKTGFGTVFNSDTVQQAQEVSFELFQDSLLNRTRRSWEEWHQGGMPVATTISLIGLLVTLGLHRKSTAKRSNYFFFSLLIIVLLTMLQQAVGWTRIWFFFAPVYFAFAAAGIVFLLNFLKLKEKVIQGLIISFTLISLGYSLAWLNSTSPAVQELRGKVSAIEMAAQYLGENATEKDAIVSSIHDFPSLQYYTFYYGIPLSQTYPANNIFTSVYVILTSPDDDVEEALHSGTRDRVSLVSAKLVYSQDELRVYKIPIVIFYDE